MSYALNANGQHGQLVRPVRDVNGTRYGTIRTATGALVSAPVVRVWTDERAAMRDKYRPAQRRRA